MGRQTAKLTSRERGEGEMCRRRFTDVDGKSCNKNLTTSILNFSASSYEFMRRVDQQCKVDAQLKRFDRKIAVTKRSTSLSFDNLTSLETRVHELKKRLDAGEDDAISDFNSNSTHSMVDREIKNSRSRRVIMQRDVGSCPVCEKIIVKALLAEHIAACSGQKGTQGNKRASRGVRKTAKERNISEEKLLDSLQIENGILEKQCMFKHTSDDNAHQKCLVLAAKPQYPRKLRVTESGCDYVRLAWDDPILDGGNAVYDFEIEYSHCRVEQKPGKVFRHFDKMPSVLCSIWCLKNPVPQKSFVLEGLTPSSEYVNIRIRCRNILGWSDFSAPVPSMMTMPPKPPSIPRFFRVTNITSSSIQFAWSAPFWLGGTQLSEYRLEYAEIVPKDNQSIGHSDSLIQQTEIKKETLSISGKELTVCLQSLKCDTRFGSFELRAITEGGTTSEPAICDDVQTLPPSSQYVLEKEIERVKASKEDFVDSDFLQDGVIQRRERIKHLSMLEEALDVMLVHTGKTKLLYEDFSLNEKFESRKQNNVIQPFTETDSDEICKVIPDFAKREAQFQFRIDVLEKELEASKCKRQEILKRQPFLTYQLRDIQERILVLMAEADRVATFPGKEITSSVLHGSEQRFTLYQLKKDIQKELDMLYEKITGWKEELLRGDKLAETLLDTISRKENQLVDRIAARKEFVCSSECATSFQDSCSYVLNKSAYYCFALWTLKVQARRNICDKLSRILIRKHSTLTTASAMIIWAKHTKKLIIVGPLSTASVVGVGGLMLQKTENEFRKNIAISTELIEDLACIRVSHAELAMQSQPLEKESHHYLIDSDRTKFIKGNFYFASGDFQHAKQFYEQVFCSLSDKPYQNMSPAVTAPLICALHEKIGQTCIELQSWSIAIVHFERLFRIANEIKSNLYTSSAYVSLGKCFSSTGDFQLAKEHYLKAMPMLCSRKDIERQAMVHEGLQLCFDRLNMPYHANLSFEEYKKLSGGPGNKASEAFLMMDTLKQRLIDVTAQAGVVVNLQKATPHSLYVLKAKMRLVEHMSTKTAQLIATQTEIDQCNEAKSQIDGEMQEARSTTKGNLLSSLIHESTQKVETGELNRRLKERSLSTTEKIDELSWIHRQLSTEIKNMTDDLKSLEEELALEHGALMQKVLERRNIRCMGLSASNTTGNNVLGKATGGVEFVVLSVEKDLYVHNIITGNLVQVFEGDELDSHLGDVRGHTSIVTCVYLSGLRLYSGSMDRSIMCWDLAQGERVYVARGHEGTVTCIHVDDEKMVSGSSDLSVILWDRKSGLMVLRAKGHSRGILCVQCGPDWCVSGDGDGEVFIWNNELKCKKRMNSKPRSKISVLKYGKLEIVSGDTCGYITVWWIQSSEQLQRCKAHDGKVNDLQFDATRIVSCGMDGHIQVIDITTGQTVQTLRGHNGHVMSVAFDSVIVLSISRDGTLRQWPWSSASQTYGGDKIHTYAAGDTLPAICEKHHLAVSDLVRWNGIKDANSLFVGQKLIVRKAHSDVPTAAERALERARSRGVKKQYRVMNAETSAHLEKAVTTNTGIVTNTMLGDVLFTEHENIPASLANRLKNMSDILALTEDLK